MRRAERLALLAAVLATACAGRGGDRDGDNRGSLAAGPEVIAIPLAVASLPLAAANSLVEWKRTQQDAPLPWIAPDRRVEAYARGQLPTAFDLDTEEYRWRVDDAWIYPFYRYNPRLSEFVLRDPISRNWEFSGESVKWPQDFFARATLMPDYDFYLVSIEPMAVVMVPTGVHRKARYQPARRSTLTERAAVPLSSVRYSTRFPAPAGKALLWFSPDLNVPIRPLSFDGAGAFQARVADALQLTCTRAADSAECFRAPP